MAHVSHIDLNRQYQPLTLKLRLALSCHQFMYQGHKAGPPPFRLPLIGLPPTRLPPTGLPPFGLRLKPFGLRLKPFGLRLKSYRLPPFGLSHAD